MGGNTDSVDMSLSKLWKIVKDTQVWHAAVGGTAKSEMTEGLSNSNNDRSISR